MKIARSVLEDVSALPDPKSPAAYFEGWNRSYLCPVDDVLLFSRNEARTLQRKSAESHLHRRFVVVICLKTAGTVSVDGVPFALRPGRAHMVFPQSYHHFLHLENTDILWLLVTFETKEPERLAMLRQRTLELNGEDVREIQAMAKLFQGGLAPGRGDALCASVSQMLGRWCLQARMKEKSELVMPARKYAGLWQRMQVQLEKLPPEDLRVEPLAAKLAISERHLRQKFKEQFSVSIGTYLRNYRIRRAIGLLASTDLSIAEIVDLCGYRSTSSFRRAFLKHTGVSPQEFRK